MSAHKDYLPNGELKEEGNYKDGKKDGIWTYWLENGVKEWEETYMDGELMKSIGWHENGKKAEEGGFKNSIPYGEWVWWYNNGQKDAEGTFKENRIRDGKWSQWYENGRMKEDGNYKDGKQDGLWTKWYEHKNDLKQLEGFCKDGKKNGLWTYWHENGPKAEEGVFNNDVKTENWIYYQKDGKIRLEEEYDDSGTVRGITDY